MARLLRHLTVTTVRRLVRRLVASGSDTSSRKTLQHVNAIRICTSMIVSLPSRGPHCGSNALQLPALYVYLRADMMTRSDSDRHPQTPLPLEVVYVLYISQGGGCRYFAFPTRDDVLEVHVHHFPFSVTHRHRFYGVHPLIAPLLLIERSDIAW